MWTVDLVEESGATRFGIYPIGRRSEYLSPRAPRRHRLIALANASDDGESGFNMEAIFAVGSSPFA
jgi:hypothetical protein